jgi:hypothetical protein
LLAEKLALKLAMWSGLMLERLLAGQLEVQLGWSLAGQLLVRQL